MKKALLIGINYVNTSSELSGCINDIYNMKNFLVQYCGYLESDIKILSDRDLKPTRQNIEQNISWLTSNCLAGDTLYFHYSGHGSYVRDTSRDETDGRDEVIIPLDFESRGVITDDWLMNNLALKIPKDVNLYSVFDCCHSGTILDLKHNYKSLCKLKRGNVRPNMEYKPVEWTNVFSYSIQRSRDVVGNICMFSGSLDPEVAADAFINNQAQGAFTFCLLECLKKNLTTLENGSKRFKPDMLKLRHVLKDVNCLLDIQRYRQNTQLSVSKQADLERLFNL